VLTERIKQLQDQVRDLMEKNSRLHQDLCDEQGESAKTEDETRDLRRQVLTKQAELEREKERLAFFISESGQSIEEAEEALAFVRARKEKANSAPQGLVEEKEQKKRGVSHARTVAPFPLLSATVIRVSRCGTMHACGSTTAPHTDRVDWPQGHAVSPL
jgi:septal ring factor EnvC (AmiA/AmiB activator)